MPEELKYFECECGLGGKNSPICYILEQDPIQEVLETKTKTTYFKLTLPGTSSEMRVARWASRTPKQFLMHVREAVHVCKEMGLETNFKEAITSIESKKLGLDITNESYPKLRKESKKMRKKGDSNVHNVQLVEAKAACDSALKTIAEMEYAVELAGKNIFKLYANL